MKTLITPEVAQDILSRNTSNRLPTPSLVALLAEEMRNGKFLYNGESIIIGSNGVLLDGQHRLLAVIDSDTSVYVNLVQGIDETVMHTIDTGKTRTAGNVFQIKNIQNANNMASAIKSIIDQFTLNQKLYVRSDIKTKSAGGSIKVTNGEKLEFYNENIDLIEPMLRYCANLYTSNIRVITPAAATAYLWLFSTEDKLAKYFIREVFTGVQEGESNAAFLLHKKLVNDKLGTAKLPSKEITNMFIYAFRLYKRGTSIKFFRGNISTTGKLLFKSPSLTPKLSSFDFNIKETK